MRRRASLNANHAHRLPLSGRARDAVGVSCDELPRSEARRVERERCLRAPAGGVSLAECATWAPPADVWPTVEELCPVAASVAYPAAPPSDAVATWRPAAEVAA